MNNKLDRLLRLNEERPRDAFTLFAIAKEYEKIDDIENSLSYYRQIIDADPDYIGVYFHLGKLLEQDQQDIAALDVYRKGIQVGENLKDFHAIAELKNAFLNLELEMGL